MSRLLSAPSLVLFHFPLALTLCLPLHLPPSLPLPIILVLRITSGRTVRSITSIERCNHYVEVIKLKSKQPVLDPIPKDRTTRHLKEKKNVLKIVCVSKPNQEMNKPNVYTPKRKMKENLVTLCVCVCLCSWRNSIGYISVVGLNCEFVETTTATTAPRKY